MRRVHAVIEPDTHTKLTAAAQRHQSTGSSPSSVTAPSEPLPPAGYVTDWLVTHHSTDPTHKVRPRVRQNTQTHPSHKHTRPFNCLQYAVALHLKPAGLSTRHQHRQGQAHLGACSLHISCFPLSPHPHILHHLPATTVPRFAVSQANAPQPHTMQRNMPCML